MCVITMELKQRRLFVRFFLHLVNPAEPHCLLLLALDFPTYDSFFPLLVDWNTCPLLFVEAHRHAGCQAIP